jgi:citrate lyase subunit beta / citryl-CoA lyase
MSRISRSFLFVPGDRPERFAKAIASGAHDIILDLEDAVAPAAKSQARDAVATWLADGGPAIVRINGADTPWFDDDVAMLRAATGARAMLPKAEPDSLVRLAQALPQRPVIALVETVAGYLALREVVGCRGVERVAFGSVDFAAESGIADEGDAMTGIRTQIVLESCRAKLAPPIDGVGLEFNDEGTMRSDALRSRQLGFGGKLCIHPRQVQAVNTAFRPSQDEVTWAQRVLAAFEQSRGAATAVDGKMIDKPVVERASRIIAEASAFDAA